MDKIEYNNKRIQTKAISNVFYGIIKIGEKQIYK